MLRTSKKATCLVNMATYCLNASDIIWLDFFQSGANEQAEKKAS